MVSIEQQLHSFSLNTEALSKTLSPWWDSEDGGGHSMGGGTLLGSWPKPTVTAEEEGEVGERC